MGPCTAAMLHLFANMDITTMRRMHAHLMVSTGLIGSWEAYLSAQDPGSTGFMDAAGIGAAEVGVAVAGAVADLVTAVGSGVAGDSEVAAASQVVMDSTATLEEDFTVAVDFTAVAAGRMVVVEGMEADTGN